MKSTLRLFRTDLLQRLPFRIQSFGHFAMLTAMIVFSMGCQKDEVVVETSSVQTHVAFAGGGWRAHTGHSGWNIALLDSGKRTLDDVYENVGTISSNSGGSWFSTMLMYSSSFDSAIEAKDAIDTWSTTGWLGQQANLFNNATKDLVPCKDLPVDLFLACVFDAYAPQGVGYWNSIITGLVFKYYPVDSTTTLDGQHLSWAEDKSLLLASTMLTSSVVLNDQTSGAENYRYYQACLSPNEPVLRGDSSAICSDNTMPIVTPVTFSSIPNSLNLTSPPFLTGNQPTFNLTYGLNASPDSALSTTLTNPLKNDQVSVVIAAAASSAAGGFLASEAVTTSWLASYEAEDEALSFQLDDSNVQFIDASNFSVQELAEKKVVRIADGGAVDNSGVAQLVSFLQLNKQAENFNIIAFDNVQTAYTPEGNGASVGTDIAYLFGEGLCPGNQFCSELDCGTPCITVPDLQIFEKSALTGTSKLWGQAADSSSTDATYEIIYTKYTVSTIDNSTLGVSKGTTGTLHAFTCVWANAATAPSNDPLSDYFQAYDEMLSFINSGLQADSAKGLKYLQAAMGMSD